MNVQRFIISAIVVFAFVFLFEMLVHAVILAGIYEQTSSIWRSHEESQGYFAYLVLSQLLFSIALVFLFTRNFEGKGIGEGARFGLYVGLILGAVQVGAYCYLPIPFVLMVGWVVAGVLKGLGGEIVASLIYKAKESPVG